MLYLLVTVIMVSDELKLKLWLTCRADTSNVKLELLSLFLPPHRKAVSNGLTP